MTSRGNSPRASKSVDARGEFAVGEVGGEFEQARGLVVRQDAFDGHSCTNSVGRVLSRRTPSSVQTTMSSIRAPCRPAR